MQFDAFFELCRMYSAWAEAGRAELVAEPWRGAYFKGRPVWKHHVKRDSEGHVINHKTFSATFFLPSIYRPEGDQLHMGLTPVWLDHNPPDGDLSKLDYNRVPILPAFANHVVSPLPAWP
eukprot:jgi/Tetstr1/445595/TSEL_003401.t1